MLAGLMQIFSSISSISLVGDRLLGLTSLTYRVVQHYGCFFVGMLDCNFLEKRPTSAPSYMQRLYPSSGSLF
jgi:hypothetical protein